MLIIPLLATLLPLQDAAAPASVPSAVPRFEALLTDGSLVRGHLAGLLLGPDGQGSLTLVDEVPRALSWSRIVKLTRQGGPAPRPQSDEVLHLVGTESLRGTIRSGDAEQLEFLPSLAPGTPLRVPVARVLSAVLNPPGSPDERRALESALADPNREGEAIWLTNGDRRPWSFSGIEGEQVRLEAETGPVRLERSGVAALAFDPALAERPSAPGPVLEAHFADGSRLALAGATLDAATLQIQTRSNLSLRVASTALLEVYPRTGAVAFLCEREPAARDFVPYLDRHPSRIGLDTTWDGSPLTVRGRRLAHGVGMLPRTLVAYRIEPGDERFQAAVAVDDRAGEQASVVFRVLLDRREAFVSPPMTRQSDPLAIDLAVGDARLLVLIAEFGERGDVQDHADWIGPRVLRQTPP